MKVYYYSLAQGEIFRPPVTGYFWFERDEGLKLDKPALYKPDTTGSPIEYRIMAIRHAVPSIDDTSALATQLYTQLESLRDDAALMADRPRDDIALVIGLRVPPFAERFTYAHTPGRRGLMTAMVGSILAVEQTNAALNWLTSLPSFDLQRDAHWASIGRGQAATATAFERDVVDIEWLVTPRKRDLSMITGASDPLAARKEQAEALVALIHAADRARKAGIPVTQTNRFALGHVAKQVTFTLEMFDLYHSGADVSKLFDSFPPHDETTYPNCNDEQGKK